MADSPTEYFLRNALGEGDRDAEADVVCKCWSKSKYEPRLEPAIEPGREDESGGCNVWVATLVYCSSGIDNVLVVTRDTGMRFPFPFFHSKMTSPRAAVEAVSPEIKGASLEVHSLTIVSSPAGAHRLTVQVYTRGLEREDEEGTVAITGDMPKVG